jgi:hypothetical protein
MSNIINLTQATAETHAYQNDSQFQGLTKSCAIDKSAYDQLLAQPRVEKVRTYFSLDTNNKLSIVVVGVDAQGEHLTTGILLGNPSPCPYICPLNSPLM